MLLKTQCSLSITLAVRMDCEIGFLILLSIFCFLDRYLPLSSVVNFFIMYQKKKKKKGKDRKHGSKRILNKLFPNKYEQSQEFWEATRTKPIMLLKTQCSLSIPLAARMDGEIGFLLSLSIFCFLDRYLLLSSAVNFSSWYQKKEKRKKRMDLPGLLSPWHLIGSCQFSFVDFKK